MRLLVAGGRDWTDRSAVDHVLNRVNRKTPITCVIEGEGGKEFEDDDGTKVVVAGVDLWAREWANRRGALLDPFPVPKPDWKLIGKKAGPLRNQRMIDEGKPDGAVIFPGGRGTQDMRRRLQKAGITRFEPIPLVSLEEKEAKAR